jgi:hypothetical protein
MKRFLGLVFLALTVGGCAVYADPYPSAYVAPPSVYVQTPGVVVEPIRPMNTTAGIGTSAGTTAAVSL